MKSGRVTDHDAHAQALAHITAAQLRPRGRATARERKATTPTRVPVHCVAGGRCQARPVRWPWIEMQTGSRSPRGDFLTRTQPDPAAPSHAAPSPAGTTCPCPDCPQRGWSPSLTTCHGSQNTYRVGGMAADESQTERAHRIAPGTPLRHTSAQPGAQRRHCTHSMHPLHRRGPAPPPPSSPPPIT
jgi:hypothetical protein